MSGGTPRHALLQNGLGSLLYVALRGRRCVPYGPDLRLFFPDLDESAYADAAVICGRLAADPRDPNGGASG